eukprot:EG_transcript_7909
MYSFSAGVSVLIIAYLAPIVERRRLHPLSFCEFIGWRYGAVPQIGITLLAIFTMSMSMLVELQTMGYLFRWYVPSIAWPINLAIGGQTLVYSCMAGLAVSIAVGQAQAGMGLFLVSVLAVYLLFTFNVNLAHHCRGYRFHCCRVARSGPAGSGAAPPGPDPPRHRQYGAGLLGPAGDAGVAGPHHPGPYRNPRNHMGVGFPVFQVSQTCKLSRFLDYETSLKEVKEFNQRHCQKLKLR